MSLVLSPETYSAAREESEGSREQRRGQAVYARSLAESYYRDHYDGDDARRWSTAKAWVMKTLYGVRQ